MALGAELDCGVAQICNLQNTSEWGSRTQWLRRMQHMRQFQAMHADLVRLGPAASQASAYNMLLACYELADQQKSGAWLHVHVAASCLLH